MNIFKIPKTVHMKSWARPRLSLVDKYSTVIRFIAAIKLVSRLPQIHAKAVRQCEHQCKRHDNELSRDH